MQALKAIRDFARVAFGITLLAVMCALWGLASALLLLVLPADTGRRVGRVGAMLGFRTFLSIMQAIGVLRLDLEALDSLRGEGPLIIAPNHPSLLDAVLVVSRLPNALCVMKASLVGNFLLGPAARLGRYVKNDSLIGLTKHAATELRLGGHLVLFPEGTRSTRMPVGAFTTAVGAIARRATVPVQTVMIESDTPFLGKGWSIWSKHTLPVQYRIRLGRRFASPSDVRAFTTELEAYFAGELAKATPDPLRDAAGQGVSGCASPE